MGFPSDKRELPEQPIKCNVDRGRESLIEEMDHTHPLEMQLARAEMRRDIYKEALENVEHIVPPCFGCLEVGMQVSRIVYQALHPEPRTRSQ